jgi:hypothetical protein
MTLNMRSKEQEGDYPSNAFPAIKISRTLYLRLRETTQAALVASLPVPVVPTFASEFVVVAACNPDDQPLFDNFS